MLSRGGYRLMKLALFPLLCLSLAAPCLVLAAPSAALAQDPPAQEPIPEEGDDNEVSGPKMNLEVAPPGAPVQRKAYVHEGFYFRFNVGPGWMYTTLDSTTDAVPDVDAHSFSLGSDLMLGGSPSPGIAVGGGLLTNIGFGADYGVAGANGTILHFMAGPFFDAFPNDKRGWHLGTMLGFSGLALGGASPSSADSAFGGGGAVWGGYDMWVAPEWSVGFDLRGTGAYMIGDDLGAGAFSMMFMISILHH